MVDAPEKRQTINFKSLKPLGFHVVVLNHDVHSIIKNSGKILILGAHPRPVTPEHVDAESVGPVMMTAMSGYGQGGAQSSSLNQVLHVLESGDLLMLWVLVSHPVLALPQSPRTEAPEGQGFLSVCLFPPCYLPSTWDSSEHIVYPQ